MPTLLLITVLLPLAGALLLGGDRTSSRQWALAVALVTFGMAVVLVARYPGGIAPYAAIDFPWLGTVDTPFDVRFSMALDGLNVWLFALTALLMIVAVLVGWEAIDRQASLYYRLLLVLETGMLGVFVARDIILFYVFFEFTLIPLFFLIGIWGSHERRRAALKFFLYTFAGSVLTFLGLLAIVLWNYWHPMGDPTGGKMTFSIPALTQSLADGRMDLTWQVGIFLALSVGFAIKVPLVPLHTWLPLAHVEAPTAGSVLLAGVLLKVGSYGFARFNLPMLPEASVLLMPWLLAIALAGVIYGALVALVQGDIKRLVAYSSVSHMGLVMAGLFALNRLSIEGGVLQMINHGLSTGGLFAVVGMLYERYHTRQIAELGGLARRLPILAFFAVVLALSSIAVPGLNGFVGEFLVLLGVFQRGWLDAPGDGMVAFRILGVVGVFGVILSAWYMLWMVQRVFFGHLREPEQKHGETPPCDLSLREIGCLTPLVVLIVWIGLYPRFFLDRMTPTVNDLMKPAMRAADKSIGNQPRNLSIDVGDDHPSSLTPMVPSP